MSIYADMYPEWIPPCPKEEQAAEEWLEYMKMRNDKEE